MKKHLLWIVPVFALVGLCGSGSECTDAYYESDDVYGTAGITYDEFC